MTSSPASIAIVDDDASVLRSLSRLLSAHGFEVHSFSSPLRLLRDIATLRPGCIVADLSMPELTGLELQEELAARRYDYPLVFVTGRGDIRSSVQAMRGGAVDFLVKPFDKSELFDAIGRAFERTKRLRERRDHVASFRERVDTLTRREREVFAQVVDGHLNKQIAAQLGITEKTVKVHRARVMRKMAVRSVAQLARIAERFGIPATQ